jgi:hypothetical protein
VQGQVLKLYEDESLTEEERNKRVTEADLLLYFTLAENIMSEEEQKLEMAKGNSQGVIKAILDEINAQGERREVLAEFLSLQLDAIDAEREFKDAVDTTATSSRKVRRYYKRGEQTGC